MPGEDEKSQAYQWFCLEHVREYNAKWNFFDGMDAEHILAFQREAELRHRPTWLLGHAGKAHLHAAQEKIFDFTNQFNTRTVKDNTMPVQEQGALHTLDLHYPVSLAEIKQQYRALVKRYHPDKNQGCEKAAARFKAVHQAYQVLCQSSFFEETAP